MNSSPDDHNFHCDGTDDSCLASLTRMDSNEMSLSVNLDAVRQSMLQSLSSSPSSCLKDGTLSDSLQLASNLLIESIKETGKSLSRDSAVEDIKKKLSLWENSLVPWQEFLKNVKNVGTVPASSIQGLLDFVPEIIQIVFAHCKRSETLYGQKFNDLVPQLTSLYRRTSNVLDSFFTILETNVEFEQEAKSERNSLKTVLEKIGNIAVLTNGMDSKTQINAWKAFAKIATTHQVILKNLDSTCCVTRRYADVLKDVESFLVNSVKDHNGANYERGIQCAAVLLKILVRLCTLYRGYCGNKVFVVLVQLLAKLHRYLPPFIVQRFIHANSKINECLATRIVPTITELLNVIVDENEFRKAFFVYGKSELNDPIFYHLLTLRVIEELLKQRRANLSLWMQENNNIIDIALADISCCRKDLLIDELGMPVGKEIDSAESGIYRTTLRLICQLIARTSADDFAALENALLKYLLSGEFWSCLLSCDSWTFLSRIASPDLCSEHLSFLIKVQKSLAPRENSLEYGILSALIGRLYRSFGVEKSGEERRESLPPRVHQFLVQQWENNMRNDRATIFQELRRSPSVKNWTQLTSLLKYIGSLASSKDERFDVTTLCLIWSFVSTSIPKSAGVIREMLLELVTLLFDCTGVDYSKISNNDRLIASIFTNIAGITEHLPTQHRIKMNVFLRESLISLIDVTEKQSLSAIKKLFCGLINDENFWVRQESFETYADHILKGPNTHLFDSLSIGISELPLVKRQISSYFSNTQIHALKHYSSLENYLLDLAEFPEDRSTLHRCYEPDFNTREEKRPRFEIGNIDKRICDICDELESVLHRKNDLSSDTTDRLRMALIKLLEN